MLFSMIKYAILLAAISGVALGLPEPQGAVPQVENCIIGGGSSLIVALPYVVSLQVGGIHHCGGVIINESVILTAAHCVSSRPIENLQIRAGSMYHNSGGVVVDVAAVRMHDKFKPATMENNIAVLRLRQPLSFCSNIKAIPLARVDPANNSLGVVCGWGATTPGAPPRPNQLHYAHVNTIGRFSCSSPKYGYGGTIKLDMICAAAPGQDTCDDDGGGPLVVDNLLVGITSWGYGCTNARYPGVYVDVPYHRNWIDNALKWL